MLSLLTRHCTRNVSNFQASFVKPWSLRTSINTGVPCRRWQFTQSRRKADLLRPAAFCCVFTAGAFGLASVVTYERRRRRVDDETVKRYILTSVVAACGTVTAFTYLGGKWAHLIVEKCFHHPLMYKSPFRLVSVAFGHFSVLHLFANSLSLMVLMGSATRLGLPPENGLATVMTGVVWSSFLGANVPLRLLARARGGFFKKVYDNLSNPIGGMSGGLMALLGLISVFDTSTYYLFFVPYPLTLQQITYVAATFDTLGLCMLLPRSLRMAHAGHLAGLGCGLGLAHLFGGTLERFQSLVLKHWVKYRS